MYIISALYINLSDFGEREFGVRFSGYATVSPGVLP